MNPSQELCGMFILTAGQMGLDSVHALMPHAAAITPKAIDSSMTLLWEAIVENLDCGRPPTEANLLAVNPRITGSMLAQAKAAANNEQGHGGIEAVVAVIQKTYTQTQNRKWLTAALEANARGDHAQMATLIAQIDLLDPAAHQERSRFEEFRDVPILERPLRLTHNRLNYALRGGLGTGRLLGMSLWVAPTGMGKSTFWYGEIPYLCEQGHWVLYFAAEADPENIYSEVVRLYAGMTMDGVERMSDIPTNAQKFRDARDRMQAYMGRSLIVWSGAFDCQTVRHQAERTLKEMRDEGARGKLLVIIDNYDALYEMAPEGSKSVAMSINDEIHRLSRHVGEFDYHIAMLAQSTAEDELRKEPGSGQVYGNRKIGQKFGTVVSLYRPRRDEADGTRPAIAIRKARQGRHVNPIIPMQPDDAVGLWVEVDHG